MFLVLVDWFVDGMVVIIGVIGVVGGVLVCYLVGVYGVCYLVLVSWWGDCVEGVVELVVDLMEVGVKV